ncbi:response regulator [Pseudoalteromonas piscicida]|uniref:histidine kinase n=1 Tax=Pseudoalteromonas piscicida TaxID=43662 RepID=A0A2A5JPB9_PSEO7|nr:response regulator [Pseudoalteromonas piscicida]PCK31293.1 hybrid sensor histidine kinase/response regulator [Pseudoalteromonas piscicida]
MSILKRLHLITTNQDTTFDEKVTALLLLGLDVFALDIAIVAEIHAHIYTVKHVITPDNALLPGTEFNFTDTYCWHTYQADSALSFSHAGKSSIATHPCYQNFALESYIGAPIIVDGQRYGTVNFSASGAKAEDFTQEHLDYVSLLGQWIGVEISRQKSLKQLQHRSEALAAMSRLADIGSWEVDFKKNKVYWSQQTRAIHGVTDDFIPTLDNAISFYKPGFHQGNIKQAIDNAITSKTKWDIESIIIDANGNEKWVASHGQGEYENGECVRVYGAIQDIDEQVKMRLALEQKRAEAEQLLKTRSDFIAKISHELRTPLNGLVGMLQACKNETDIAEIKDNLTVAVNSADMLITLINDVLDFSKLNSNNLKLDNTAFDLHQLIAQVIELYRPACQDKGLEVCFDVDNQLKQWLYSDPTRVKQILANLVSNAIKFTPSGKINLDAKILGNHTAPTLQLSVSDTGIGIAKATQSLLFQPFSQGDASVSRRFGGTGLGLSIVFELCNLLNGEVEVQSEPDKGSTFIVTFPVEFAEQATESPSFAIEEQHITLKSCKILLVDDNQINVLVMEKLLSQFGATQIDKAYDGKQAVKVCQEKQFDIVFMDCVMPTMDGFEATKNIRKLSVSNSQVPHIIALTANTSESDKTACYHAGMNDFLSKPIQLEALKGALTPFIR